MSTADIADRFLALSVETRWRIYLFTNTNAFLAAFQDCDPATRQSVAATVSERMRDALTSDPPWTSATSDEVANARELLSILVDAVN
jgi:hypothetical protein